MTTLQLGVIALAGVIVVAVTQPFLPPLRGLALLGLVTGLLAIAFWRSAINLEGHARAGAQIVAAALAQQLPATEPAEPKPPSPLDDLLSSLGQPVAMTLEPGTSGIGKSLTGLNLRGLTGATVLAIHRDGQDVLLPTGREKLRVGDVVILAGTHEAIVAAQELLR
jgi:CPA2 family monovalent cation:H+ antiporter-2